MNIECDECKNLITVSVYGILSPCEFSQLEAHLQNCPECAQIFEKTTKMTNLNHEPKDMQLPDKEKSWQIIKTKAIKKRHRWFQYFAPRQPAFQASLAVLLLVLGFAGGFFIQSNSRRGTELAEIRQEVLQIREITAASLLRQESLSMQLQEMSVSSRLEQSRDPVITNFFKRLTGASDSGTRQIPAGDSFFFLRDPAARNSLIQSLSDQTSPLVEIALAFTRYLQQ